MSQSITVVALWSGGLDSTAVIAACLANGYDVHALSLVFNGKDMEQREMTARERLTGSLRSLAHENRQRFDHVTEGADWLWRFSPDGIEIPRRNKHMIDYAIMSHAHALKTTTIAIGEYTGADTWVVRDHVGAADADTRALTAYVYQEYGIDYQLLTLDNFGLARYKSDRLCIGYEYLGDDISLMTNCLRDSLGMCGACYKCIERAAAFDVSKIRDRGMYLRNPREHDAYQVYVDQMHGERVTLTHALFENDTEMAQR